MAQHQRFQLTPSPNPITAPVTKFGGQPVWLAPPQWPLEPETGAPMRFLAQVAPPPALFPAGDGVMVYLFFSDASEPIPSEAFAAVIQRPPQVTRCADPAVAFVPQATGRALVTLTGGRRERPVEYAVRLYPPAAEPDLPLAQRYGMGDLDYGAGFQFAQPALAGNKLGGQAMYIEGLSEPPPLFSAADWRLLLQLAPERGYWTPRLRPNFYPFAMELGEFGILTVLIRNDYSDAACFVQLP